jgi:hypothetical protein
MIRKTILSVALVSPLVLVACTTGSATTDTANAIACSLALLDSGISDPQALAKAALTTPACAALASDIVNQIISQVQPKAAARAALRR